MANRYGRAHLSLPHCIRQLPENQPRNKREYMIRKRAIPEDPDMYFDNAGRFLYENKCMSQELEKLKISKRNTFNILHKQAQYVKALITKEKEKPRVDIASMRARYNRAQSQAYAALTRQARKPAPISRESPRLTSSLWSRSSSSALDQDTS